MPTNEKLNTHAIDVTGETIDYRAVDVSSQYILTGSGTLSGGVTVRQALADPVAVGITYKIWYQASIVYAGGNTITIFGRVLTALEAMNTLEIEAQYNGSSWDVTVLYVRNQVIETIEISTAGGTDTADWVNVTDYLLIGSGTLSSSYTLAISGDVPTTAVTVKATYNGAFVLDGNSVTIWGYLLTSQQALNGVVVESTYDTVNSVWNTIAYENVFVKHNDQTSTTTYVSGNKIVELDPNIDQRIQVIDGDTTMTGDLLFSDAGTWANGQGFEIFYNATLIRDGNNVNIFGSALTDQEALAGNTYLRVFKNSSTIVVEKITPNLFTTYPLTVPVSFDADEIGTLSVPIPSNFVLVEAAECVSKEIENSDNGTIAYAIDGVSTSPSSQTITGGGAVGTLTTTTFTTNNTGSAGSTVDITTSKITAGGKVLITLTIQKAA